MYGSAGNQPGRTVVHPSGVTLSSYVDGELETAERVLVEAHLRNCETCRLNVQHLRHQSDLFRRVPVERPPVSLRREIYRKIEEHDAARRPLFPWLAGFPLPSANVMGLAVTAILLVVMAPQLVGVWSVFSGRLNQPVQRAAPQEADAVALASPTPGGPTPTVPAEGVAPASTVIAVSDAAAVAAVTTVAPTPAASPTAETHLAPSPTVAPASSPAPTTLAATTVPAGQTPGTTHPADTAPVRTTKTGGTPAGNTDQAGQTQPNTAGAGPAVTGATATVTLATPATQPTPAATPIPVQMRIVSGKVTGVDRKQRLLTLQVPGTGTGTAGATGGATGQAGATGATGNTNDGHSWTVRLSEGTLITALDGKRLQPEDVGLADDLEVSGFETAGGTAAPVLAASVKVVRSAVAAVAPRPKVVVLLDGAPNIHPPQFSYTGDWIKHLNESGYDVTAIDPAIISTGSASFAGANLIVVGYPATLSDAALQSVRNSRLPVLDAEPRLVQALGLGLNADPAQPTRNVGGRTVDVSSSGGALANGFGSGTVVGNVDLYRTPIVASGTTLATVSDGGQARAVWALSGNVMYFGFYYSANGQNHTAAYWTLFDRSVQLLLGKEPAPAPVGSTSRTAATVATVTPLAAPAATPTRSR